MDGGRLLAERRRPVTRFLSRYDGHSGRFALARLSPGLPFWDAYRDAFVAEHLDLTEAQKLRFSEMLDGPRQFTVPLAKLPAA